MKLFSSAFYILYLMVGYSRTSKIHIIRNRCIDSGLILSSLLKSFKSLDSLLCISNCMSDTSCITLTFDRNSLMCNQYNLELNNETKLIYSDFVDIYLNMNSNLGISNENNYGLKGTLFKEIPLLSSLQVFCIRVLHTGDFAGGFSDFSIGIWSQADFSLNQILAGHESAIKSLIVLPNNDFVSSDEKGLLKVWTLISSVKWDFSKDLIGHTSNVLALTISLKDNYLVSGSYDKSIRVWDTSEGKSIYEFNPCSCIVFTLTTLQNGQIAGGFIDNTIKILDLIDGSIKKMLTGHSNSILDLDVLLNGDLASCSADQTIKIWDSKNNWIIKFNLIGHKNIINAIVLLKNGLLASASADSTIRIWNGSNGSIISTFSNPRSGNIDALDVLKNGYIVSSSQDFTIKIWE